jgi:predicted PurR-regulated permease PerM
MADQAEESLGGIRGNRPMIVGQASPLSRSSIVAAPYGSGLLVAIFTILVIVALRLGSAPLIPITVSILLTLLLGPLVRGLRRRGVPEWIGAGFLVFGTIGLLGTGVGFLAGPAVDWIQRSPATLSLVEAKVRKLIRPLKAIQQTAHQVEQAASPSDGTPAQKVQVQTPARRTRSSSDLPCPTLSSIARNTSGGFAPPSSAPMMA